MNINSLFFSDSELLLLEVYIELSKLKTKQTVSIKALSESLFLSYGQVSRYLVKIQHQLTEMDEWTKGFVIKNGLIEFLKDFPEVDSYRTFFAQKTIPFQVLLALLNEEYATVEEFLDAQGISKTTLHNKTKNLNAFAKFHGVTISYTPFQINGKEFAVRTFFFDLLWLICNGKDIFTKDEKILSNAYETCALKENYIFNTQCNYWLRIIEKRVLHGHEYTPPENLEHLLTYYSDIHLIESRKVFTEEQLKRETLFLKVYALIQSIRLKRYVINDNFFQYLNLEESHVIHKTATLLNKILIKERILTKDMDQTRVNNLILYIALVQYITSSPFPSNSLFYKEDNAEFKELQKKITQALTPYKMHLKDYLNDLSLPFLSRMLTRMIVNSPKQYVQKKVRIALSIEPNNPNIRNIISTLVKYPNIEIDWFNPEKDYDYVIHTLGNFSEEFPELDSFYWQFHYEKEELQLLEQIIIQLLNPSSR
ncbi:Protein of unknown function [Pilibacter termitis]|uniref:Mga helix-turn-helix domain-containing protein n=1 Tax=Pilibacter termitis TaxID=263852 RepID=A0A1T4L9H2_9ENTE|nr:helix-turn-helix domain-containing protein [Pilibacter termitis]SJZ51221.1 Protein of unknown function [Pilibacter termitis]